MLIVYHKLLELLEKKPRKYQNFEFVEGDIKEKYYIQHVPHKLNNKKLSFLLLLLQYLKKLMRFIPSALVIITIQQINSNNIYTYVNKQYTVQ